MGRFTKNSFSHILQVTVHITRAPRWSNNPSCIHTNPCLYSSSMKRKWQQSKRWYSEFYWYIKHQRNLTFATNTRSADLHGLSNLLFGCSLGRGLLENEQNIRSKVKVPSWETYIMQAFYNNETTTCKICRAIKTLRTHCQRRVLGVNIALLFYATLWHRNDTEPCCNASRGNKYVRTCHRFAK